MGSSNNNKFPWNWNTGWNIGANEKIRILFAASGADTSYPTGFKTTYIRGMVFLKEQLTEPLQLSLQINYGKDTVQSVDSFYDPSKVNSDSTSLDLKIKSSDLDESGIFFFKDPDDQTKTLEFACMKIELHSFSGPDILNFDFIGTYYDFEVAVDGLHDDWKADEYNTLFIGKVLAKGEILSIN